MQWILLIAVPGWLSGEIRFERVTEAQCRAIEAHWKNSEGERFATCLSPDGKFTTPLSDLGYKQAER